LVENNTACIYERIYRSRILLSFALFLLSLTLEAKELENSEDRGKLIDELGDLWATLEVLTDQIGEVKAIQIVTTHACSPQEGKHETVLV
jgi:hypothetical protein